MQLTKWIAPCRVQLRRCRFAMRKGVVHLYKARGVENRHSAPRWHWSHNLGYWISMLKLNAPDEFHWRRSNMNKRDPILMKYVEVWMQLPKLIAPCRVQLKRCRFAMRKGVQYTFSHCESASVHLRSADCIGVVSWGTTPAKVASYRHSTPL